jgi:hypothetical protein
MKEDGLILYLPFDDPDGSGVAYDYSSSRADAVLSGDAGFSRNAMKGKSFQTNEGSARTNMAIPFSSDFTLIMYVLPVTNRLGWVLNFSGIDNYQEHWIDVVPEKWISIVFLKRDNHFIVYKDLIQVDSVLLESVPIGLSLNDQQLMAGTKALVDELVLYNQALSMDEISDIVNNANDVEYFINGINFKDFGVYVSKSNGLVGQLERKEGATAEYDTYHGRAYDYDYVRYKERKITLECFIEAHSRTSFIEWMNYFFEQFRIKGTRRLRVEYNGSTKPLVYEVLMLESADPEKTFPRFNEKMMVGTFTLVLEEPDPVKMVLRHIGASANSQSSLTVTTAKKLAISWGDGEFTRGVVGTRQTVTHTYANPGAYDIIVSGNIEDIEYFDTNDIVVWQKLM